MMDIMNALAYGTAVGLGTPQQQRENVFRQSELDQRRMLAQQELETRRATQEAEAKRFEAQYGNATPDEMSIFRKPLEESGFAIPPTAAISRPMLQQLLNAAHAMPMQEVVDPATYLPIGQTKARQAPMLPGVQGEYEAPNPDVEAGENPEPSGRQTVAPQDPRKALLLHPGTATQVLARRREEETERRRVSEDTTKASKEAEKLKQIQAARNEYAAKVPLEQILAKFPQVTAKDVYGYEPASPSTARETPKNLEQRYLDALEVPVAQRTPVQRQIILDYQGQHPDREKLEAERNADRDAKASDQIINQIDGRYNQYLDQFGLGKIFSMPPPGAKAPIPAMTKGEYIALTEPGNRYKKYFGREAPDLDTIKQRRIRTIMQTMYPNVDFNILKAKDPEGFKKYIKTASGVLKREIAEIPEE